MSSYAKLFRFFVIASVVCLLGFLLIDNVAFDRKNGVRLRGNLELSWEPPAENDVSANSLTGYTIHCWNSADRTTKTIVVEDPAATSYALDHLWPGDYQCAMSSMLTDGSRSALSNVVTRSVP